MLNLQWNRVHFTCVSFFFLLRVTLETCWRWPTLHGISGIRKNILDVYRNSLLYLIQDRFWIEDLGFRSILRSHILKVKLDIQSKYHTPKKQKLEEHYMYKGITDQSKSGYQAVCFFHLQLRQVTGCCHHFTAYSTEATSCRGRRTASSVLLTQQYLAYSWGVWLSYLG